MLVKKEKNRRWETVNTSSDTFECEKNYEAWIYFAMKVINKMWIIIFQIKTIQQTWFYKLLYWHCRNCRQLAVGEIMWWNIYYILRTKDYCFVFHALNFECNRNVWWYLLKTKHSELTAANENSLEYLWNSIFRCKQYLIHSRWPNIKALQMGVVVSRLKQPSTSRKQRSLEGKLNYKRKELIPEWKSTHQWKGAPLDTREKFCLWLLKSSWLLQPEERKDKQEERGE